MPLSDPLQKHFLDPQNTGDLARASATGEAENKACGDRLAISVRVAEGVVEELSFRARGCSAVIATASLTTAAARGLGLAEARALDVAALVEEAGGLPRHKQHAIEIVTRALASALA